MPGLMQLAQRYISLLASKILGGSMRRRKLLLSTLSLFLFLSFACNKPSDDAVTTSIKAKLYSEPLLKSASVDVIANDGIVTLTGHVPNAAAPLAAQHITRTAPREK